jgi:HNH endonuclease
MKVIVLDYLKGMLNYNEITGIFTWKYSKGNNVKTIAGAINAHGYREIMIDGKSYQASKLAIYYITGEYPDKVDHIDGNRANDSFINLRLCNKFENNWNRKISSLNSSGIKGLSLNKQNRWSCSVTIKGKRVLKYFKLYEKESAINWLQITRQQLHKEFTNHG